MLQDFSWLATLADLSARRVPCVLVTVMEAKGSTPREAGTKMVVTADAQLRQVGLRGALGLSGRQARQGDGPRVEVNRAQEADERRAVVGIGEDNDAADPRAAMRDIGEDAIEALALAVVIVRA